MISVIMSPKNTKQAFTNEKACVFCNISEDNELKYGKIYEYDGIVTHYYCLLLSSNMQQRGSDEEGILGFLPADIQKELNRGRRLCCFVCKKKGATLGCVNKKCKKVFHYPCGIKVNTLHQFFDQFKSFCSVHRPKQHIDQRVRNETSDRLVCYICYESVERDDIYKTLWAPCCKKNAWFHRDCVQQLALSAGYFFKCPLCNNKKDFQKSMQECGIYVPCQDASWELVPNAFQELLYRHNRCDAKICLCPYGSDYTGTNGRWELLLCRTCGSQGIHIDCGKLSWMNRSWECSECSLILNKNGLNNTEQLENEESAVDGTAQYLADDDSSSDVSIGDETHEKNFGQALNLPTINLKPGPRSAKLKQLHEKVENISHENSSPISTIDQLNDILDQQQANQFPEKAFNREKSSTSQSLPHKNIADQDVITVDDDDDESPGIRDAHTLLNDPVTASSSSLMNIKITAVTSLPPEVFATVPDFTRRHTNHPHKNTARFSAPANTFSGHRKADSPSVVSRIVNRVNDCIDIPAICPKKPRMDTNYIEIDGATSSPTANLSQPFNNISINYPNGTNMNPGYSTSSRPHLHPFNSLNEQALMDKINIAKNSELSNSDGDAGTRSINNLAKNAVIVSELSVISGRSTKCPEPSDLGLSTNTSELSANDCYGRRRRSDGCRSTEWTVDHSHNNSECNKSTGSNRLRLITEKKLLLKNLKFRVCEEDKLEITVKADYKFKISLDTAKRQKTVHNNNNNHNNNGNNSLRNKLTRSLPVRRSRSLHHKIEDFQSLNNTNIINSSTITLCNNNFGLTEKPSRTFDLTNSDNNHNNFLHCNDSTHTLWLCKNDKNELINCCKYNNNGSNNKYVAKENLVPEMSYNERQSNSNFDSLMADKKFQDFIRDNRESPGTSRDNFRELSEFSIKNNRRHFLNTNHVNLSLNNYSYYTHFNKMHNTSNSSCRIGQNNFFTSMDIKCHVSIDLNRIQSLIDSKPTLFVKKNENLVRTPSLSDLRLFNFDSRNNFNLLNRKKRVRSKSDSSIYSSTIEIEKNIFRDNHLLDNKKKKRKKRQRKKKASVDKYDYCR